MTASYLLSVLSSVIFSCLDFRLLHANYMNDGISFEVVRMPYWRSQSGRWKPWWQPHIC